MMHLRELITITFLYEFDPISMFHPLSQGCGSSHSDNPNGDAVLSTPDPSQSLLAISLPWQ
jgi:hypothetical protein